MDFQEIKKITPKNGERYIFMEEGEPKAVLLSFEDYQKNVKQNEVKADVVDVDANKPDKADEADNVATAPVEPPRLTSQTANIPRSGLTLEDLPL